MATCVLGVSQMGERRENVHGCVLFYLSDGYDLRDIPRREGGREGGREREFTGIRKQCR